MKCGACGYDGEKSSFGVIDASGSGWVSLLCSKAERWDGLRINVGAIKLYACPECGTVKTDMKVKADKAPA